MLFSVLLATAGCEKRDLRGTAVPSKDGQTYLVVEDDNGGKCGPIFVDGKLWPHALHAPGAVSPGRHTIKCGTEVAFEIRPNTIFHLDYWGP